MYVCILMCMCNLSVYAHEGCHATSCRGMILAHAVLLHWYMMVMIMIILIIMLHYCYYSLLVVLLLLLLCYTLMYDAWYIHDAMPRTTLSLVLYMTLRHERRRHTARPDATRRGVRRRDTFTTTCYSTHACMHVCMHACMHVCMHVCMHGCMHGCMDVGR